MPGVQRSLQWHADKIARRNGLDPHIFRALVQQESGWDTDIRSPVGAAGLTQLMPATARGLGVRNVNNPLQNLRGGARYLSQQLKAFGNYREALAAYNAGPGAVQRYGGIPPYAETQNYVRSILGNAKGINVSSAGLGGGGGQRGGGKGLQGGGRGALSPGVTIPGVQGAQGLPEGSAGIVPLLQALSQQKPSMGQSAGLQAPDFAAGPQMAGPSVASSGGPQPKQDLAGLLSAIQTVGGGVSNAPSTGPVEIPGVGKVPGHVVGQGVHPPPGQIEGAIQRAKHWLGTSEVNGTNRGAQVDRWERRFGMVGQAWCGLFLGNILKHVGVKGVDSRIASVAAIEQMAKQGSGGMSRWLPTSAAQPGDLLVTSKGNHVVLVTGVKGNQIFTIGGNSGNKVQRVTYTKGSTYGIARPNYGRR